MVLMVTSHGFIKAWLLKPQVHLPVTVQEQAHFLVKIWVNYGNKPGSPLPIAHVNEDSKVHRG